MRLTTPIAIALATLLIAAGAVAALPGNAPTGVPANEHAQAENATQPAPANGTENGSAVEQSASVEGEAAANAEHGASVSERGPPTDVPEQVPDHVSAIHDLIRGFLDGTVDDLGEAIRDVTPGNDERDSSSYGDAETTTA